jgi:zinc transport system ATP-binding protein
VIRSSGAIAWAPDVRLGYVPQKLDLARDIPVTGLDFLTARLALGAVPASRARELLAGVGVSEDVAKRPIGALSGGQFQRLLVAFALAAEPNVLLLDEPTSGVDEPGQERVNEIIARLQRERQLTVILISHDLSVVYRRASLVLCLGRDRHWFGPPRDVLTPERLAEVYGEPVSFHTHDR